MAELDFDINKYLGNQRGAAAASANPNVGPGRPSVEAEAFRASRTAAPSLPVTENPAPVATATNASKLSFGQRLLNVMRSGARATGTAAGALAVGTVGTGTALDVAGKTTADYEKELSGLGVGQGTRYANGGVQLARDVGVRGLGALADLGRNTLRLIPGMPSFGSPNAPTAAPAAAPAASAPALIFPPGVNSATGARGAAAASFIGGSSTDLTPGTGVTLDNQTGRVVTIGQHPEDLDPTAHSGRAQNGPIRGIDFAAPSAPSANSLRVFEPRGATGATAGVPTLGTRGTIFENLVAFAGERNRAMLAAAGGAREVNRAVKAAQIARIGIEGENAVSNRMKAQADVEKARSDGKKVAYDVTGNPVIVDTKRGTAVAPKVNKPVTEADIQATMKANKLTRAQVMERLIAEGRISPEDAMTAVVPPVTIMH